MLVVVVGIIPLIWLYVNARLKQESEENQSAFWVIVMFVVTAVLFYTQITATMNATSDELLLYVPVALGFAAGLVKIIAMVDSWTNRLKEDEGYGSAIIFYLRIIGALLLIIMLDVMFG